MREFNSIEEMNPYFNEKTKTYEFIENEKLIDIEITFDLTTSGDINAWNINARGIKAGNINAQNINAWNINVRNISAHDIKARNITACDIDAWDIEAWNISSRSIDAGEIKAWNIDAWNITAGDINAMNITAWDISFHTVCYAYKNIVCKSIEGRHKNSRYFSLDGEVIIKEETI